MTYWRVRVIYLLAARRLQLYNDKNHKQNKVCFIADTSIDFFSFVWTGKGNQTSDKDKYIGKVGTPDRDSYEYELRMDVLGRMIKAARQERNLTQEQLGKLVGVQKAQISKLESSANSATIDTILKVFIALKADIHFNVTIENQQLQLV